MGRRLYAMILAVCTAVCLFAGPVSAKEADSGNELKFSLSETTLVPETDDDSADNAELFAAYFESVLYAEVEEETSSAEYVVRADADYAKSYFEEGTASYTLYSYLKEKAAEIAANGGSTYFIFDSDSSPVFTYTGCGSQDEAVALFNDDIAEVMLCLRNTMPAELYWFDKTAGAAYQINGSYSANTDGTYDYTLYVPYIKMYVASDYQGKDESGKTSSLVVDSSIAQSASEVIASAKTVVETYAEYSDYAKLKAYRNWICSEVDYNNEAASDSGTAYGDPWQIIYVFDGDADTNVVCEGYAKAFQYLCDLSDFVEDIECYTVSGEIQNSGHMWNIVTMEDGLHYLCDITNCDDDNELLWYRYFLAGASDGSVEGGYTYTYAYTYYEIANERTYIPRAGIFLSYEDDIIAYYGEDALTIAEADYEPQDGSVDVGCGDLDEEATDLSGASVTLSQYTYSYDGSNKVPTETVVLNGTTLTRGTDYNLFYRDNVYAGKAVVIAVGKGNYTGAAYTTFTIEGTSQEETSQEGTSLADADVVLSEDTYTYDGTEKTPAVTVTLNGTVLTEGIDYTVAYTDNTAAGTAAVTVTGIGNYTGSCVVPFTINECEHAYVATYTSEVSCTEGGYTTYICSACGNTYVSDETAAAGHTKGEAVVTTTDTEITYSYYCTVCGELLRTETTAIDNTSSNGSGSSENNGSSDNTGTSENNGSSDNTGTSENDGSSDNTGSADNSDSTGGSGTAGDDGSVSETGITSGSSYAVPTGSIAAEKVDLTGATEEQVSETLEKLTNDGDLAGSAYYLLQVKAAQTKKTSIKLQWKKVDGAVSYVIYANKCGKGNKLKKYKTVTGTSLNIKKIAGKKMKKGTYYKFLVVALDANGEVIQTSKVVHAATTGGKYTNQKSVTLYKGSKKISKVTLKAGKTVKIKAKTTLQQKSKKFNQHRIVKYESSNQSIATVSSKGKIKAKAKGTCYIYAYGQNGVSAKIKVTVK